ncbi:MAG: type VI secretion system ATPase TssH, partial [Clostridia bacterium]|nr:type VI secretion system ATPase TssH [Clostridia bacterium]
MNTNQWTQKSQEALLNAQTLAQNAGNQQLEQLHLSAGLLSPHEGVAYELVKRMGADPERLLSQAEEEISKLPSVSGSDMQLYLSPGLDKALKQAQKEADGMQDAYLSVEHLLLGLLRKPDEAMKKLMQAYGLTADALLIQLKEIRGNRNVNTDSPEGTYDVLRKYGQDLVQMAREKKLDPVIGRDEEIRHVLMILSRKTKNNPVLIGEPG